MQNMTEISVPETWCKSPEGKYVQDCYTHCFDPQIEEDIEAELKRWEQITAHQIADFSAASGKPHK